MIAVLASSVGVSWSCWLVLAAPGGVLLEGDMFPPQGSFVPPASWRSQRSAAPEARSCKQKLFLFQTTTSCHVHRRQEHNGLTWMSQQLNLWGHLICIKPYLWLMTVSVWVLHSFIRTVRGITILGSSGIQWRSFKGSPLFSSRKLCQISPLTQFWRILNAFGWVPLSLYPLKGGKKLLPPSLFLIPRLCNRSSAHLAPSQGQQMGVFIPGVVGVWQLACGEIGPWWETEPLITMGSGCACSDTSPPGEGGLSGTAGIEPGPPTLFIPPHIKPSTWDGKQQVPHASHPSVLQKRALSFMGTPACTGTSCVPAQSPGSVWGRRWGTSFPQLSC